MLIANNNINLKPPHEKTNKMTVRPAKSQISLGIRPVWSESSLSAWRKLGSLATHWVHSEDSDQTGQMCRLIWVFAGRTLILLVLARGGSDLYIYVKSISHCSTYHRMKTWQVNVIFTCMYLLLQNKENI